MSHPRRPRPEQIPPGIPCPTRVITMSDLRDHDGDPRDHDAPIFVITMPRNMQKPLQPSQASQAASFREVDAKLTQTMMRFAVKHFPADWEELAAEFLDVEHEESLQLRIPVVLYHCDFDEKPLVDHFLQERGMRLEPRGYRGTVHWPDHVSVIVSDAHG